jgi:predicted NAD/FAD-binding protein
MNILTWLQYLTTFLGILLLSIYRYIKSRLFGPNERVPPLYNRNSKIAIVGGGIGGVGAAYSLLRSGYKNVTIYEARDKLGGNAKTHIWQTDNTSVTTGLSVLAWPVIFHNYIHLLNELNIETTTVKLPFFIHNKEEKYFFAHGKQHIHTQQYNNDLRRWNRMVNTVRYVSEFLNGKELSLYHFSLLNPFNFISMRILSLIFGVTNCFWTNIVVPMYASSFLSTKLSFIPSSILPIIDNLISLQPNHIPTMQTWLQTSIDVFDKMTKGALIKTNHRVQNVHIQRKENNQMMISIDNDQIIYDRIIFACNSDATINALINGNTNISLLLKLMLSNVTYGDDDDSSLLDGIIHRDINILPIEYANELSSTYANYIDVKYDQKKKLFYHYNTFILSSWLPNVHAMLKENRIEHRSMEPMLVTYAPYDQPTPKIDEKKIYGKVDNRRAHPSLSFRNQAISLLIRLVQGENGMYFCGNSVTPANGHDLSLISGFAVAELIGAKYPFANNLFALRDYNRYRRMCVN